MRWPLLRRELNARLRKIRSVVFPLVFAVLLSGLFILAVTIVIQSMGGGPNAMMESGAGRLLFLILAYLQMAVFVLVTPSFTASAVVGERGEKTIELLAVTLLRAPSVVVQKFFSSLSTVLIFVAVALPVVALCYGLGGVSIGDILFFYTYLLLTVASFGALGFLFSVVARKTYLSFVLTYLTVAYLVVGCFIVAGLASFLIGLASNWQSSALESLYKVLVFPSPITPLFHMSTSWETGDWTLPAYFVFHGALVAGCGLVSCFLLRTTYRFR
jgi:ABC-type transport system involved in multi-copper enzyme maturation permease subunit